MPKVLQILKQRAKIQPWGLPFRLIWSLAKSTDTRRVAYKVYPIAEQFANLESQITGLTVNLETLETNGRGIRDELNSMGKTLQLFDWKISELMQKQDKYELNLSLSPIQNDEPISSSSEPLSIDDLPFSLEVDTESLLDRAIKRTGISKGKIFSSQDDDIFYTLFSETSGEGYEENLRRQYQAYVKLINKDSVNKVLDVGCGAGEFLQYLANETIDAMGIDSNQKEIDRTIEKGLLAECRDAREFLETTSMEFSTISLIEVIEHIHPSEYKKLLSLAYERLEPGGIIIVETINLRHPYAFNGFYQDITHIWPVPDELITFMLEVVGFESLRKILTFPVPVLPVAPSEVERIYYNYAVVAEKPLTSNLDS